MQLRLQLCNETVDVDDVGYSPREASQRGGPRTRLVGSGSSDRFRPHQRQNRFDRTTRAHSSLAVLPGSGHICLYGSRSRFCERRMRLSSLYARRHFLTSMQYTQQRRSFPGMRRLEQPNRQESVLGCPARLLSIAPPSTINQGPHICFQRRHENGFVS
jgi:hypothetical protein